ncbi:hypothetical protein TNCV_134161 [Trichonephila clavipes]|uniref:Uncharacterized protein n=1 Tax=Trichonephila inaurata madagascariensis TaxID=2747483 RepID=A0A8X6X4V4_9ARAC|nr:hypothetical protein TNCV_134161 [Trichonephila clavipes]GFY46131.1 hypothetical protein TNIN_367811 [Trichonephila inaurata madagascariensis]
MQLRDLYDPILRSVSFPCSNPQLEANNLSHRHLKSCRLTLLIVLTPNSHPRSESVEDYSLPAGYDLSLPHKSME